MYHYRRVLPLQIFIFLAFASCARAQNWPTFRHDNARTGAQPVASVLSDLDEVRRKICEIGIGAGKPVLSCADRRRRYRLHREREWLLLRPRRRYRDAQVAVPARWR